MHYLAMRVGACSENQVALGATVSALHCSRAEAEFRPVALFARIEDLDGRDMGMQTGFACELISGSQWFLSFLSNSCRLDYVLGKGGWDIHLNI